MNDLELLFTFELALQSLKSLVTFKSQEKGEVKDIRIYMYQMDQDLHITCFNKSK